MENFNAVVTDPRLRFEEAFQHIAALRTDDLYLGEYRINRTSGSTGLPAIFASSREEWSTITAAALRRTSLISESLRFRKLTMFSGHPSAAVARLGQSMGWGPRRVQRLYTDTHIEETVCALNQFQPYVLRTYASLGALLADEQIEGRLRIQPRVVTTGLEVCTAEMAAKMKTAWGIQPYETYGMVEVGLVGGDCHEHRGIHVLDDLFILEVVDQDNRPVPAGETGAKILITNLFCYTQPLIRLEVSDLVALSIENCPCGIPFPIVKVVEGRADEVLRLPSATGGTVAVHPNNVRGVMAGIWEAREYQIVRDESGMKLRLALREGVSREDVAERATAEMNSFLGGLGVRPLPVSVEFVDHFERDPARGGKHIMVRHEGPPPSPEGGQSRRS